MSIPRFYREPGVDARLVLSKCKELSSVLDVKTEYCFNIDCEGTLSSSSLEKLQWLFTRP